MALELRCQEVVAEGAAVGDIVWRQHGGREEKEAQIRKGEGRRDQEGPWKSYGLFWIIETQISKSEK